MSLFPRMEVTTNQFHQARSPASQPVTQNFPPKCLKISIGLCSFHITFLPS